MTTKDKQEPFKVFKARREVDRAEDELKTLNESIEAIQKYSKRLTASHLAKINSVCMMEVEVYHTAEVMVALGSDYFVQTVKDKALEIAKRRKELIEARLKGLKTTLLKLEKTAKEQKEELENRGQDFKGNQKILLEQNQAGEDVFQIVQHPDEEGEEVRQLKFVPPKDLLQQKPKQQSTNKILSSNEKSPVIEQQKQPEAIPKIQEPEAPPKKISRFKEERMKQKRK